MNWDIKDLNLYFTGSNFMTDGYGTGFSTQLMANENEISNDQFQQIVRMSYIYLIMFLKILMNLVFNTSIV